MTQELDDQDEIENMMFVLKKEKENLVIIRSMIPTKIQLFHHLLSQLEAIDEGERDILGWCSEVDHLVQVTQDSAGGDLEQMQAEYDRHRPFLSKTVNMQAMAQSKNNVFQSVLKNTEGKEGVDNSDVVARMQVLNDRFEQSLKNVKELDQKMLGGIQSWERFLAAEKAAQAWLQVTLTFSFTSLLISSAVFL